MGRMSGAAPTLLLVKDKGGRVFGGVAQAPWRKSGTFYGERADGGGGSVGLGGGSLSVCGALDAFVLETASARHFTPL